MIDQIRTRLGRRRLIWFGTRGDDALSLSDVPEFETCFSLQGSLSSRSSISSLALEQLTGVREDLDTFDIDAHLRSPEVGELRAAILRAVSRPSAVIPYRASTFMSAIGFSRMDACQVLGMFRGHQSAFEHKPWMESSIAELGIPLIPWRYVADTDQFLTSRILYDGPLILRRSRSTGGVGLVRVDDPSQIEDKWEYQDEAFLSVAPFIEGGIPVNVGGVVWHNGVTLHPASIQLIGLAGCTPREFGYCGNDFAAVDSLGPESLGALENSMRLIGQKLRGLGFLGAFGVDFLVKDGTPLFMEVNPRFQGSTHASCQISVEMDESCLLLEHAAAFLGIEAPSPRSLSAFPTGNDSLSHIVVHSTAPEPARLTSAPLLEVLRTMSDFCRADMLVTPAMVTQPSGVILRATVRGAVTADGFSLSDRWGPLMADATARSTVEEPPIPSDTNSAVTPMIPRRPILKETRKW